MNEYAKWLQNDTNPVRHYNHYKTKNFQLSSFLPSYLPRLNDGYNYIKNQVTKTVNEDNKIASPIESIISKQLKNIQQINHHHHNNSSTVNRLFTNNSFAAAATAALTSNFTIGLQTKLHTNEKYNLEFEGDTKNNHYVNDESYFIDDKTNNIHNSDNEIIQSGSLLFLIVIYGFVILCGVLGNASLVITLFSSASVRLRNPLLIALCIADLFVAGISAPTTIITLALTEQPSLLSSTGCKVIYYLQSMPTAASTICFLMLSLDRFITVQRPCIAQIRQKRFIHAILAVISWLGASAICLPFVLFYKLTLTSTINSAFLHSNPSAIAVTTDSNTIITQTFKSHYYSINSYNSTQLSTILLSDDDNLADGIEQDYSNASSQHHSIQNYLICQPDYDSNEFQSSFVILYTVIVYIFPGLGVLINHYGVRRKLCALSLTARAAHGELPLPMPILRRPTHVIIVTGMANAARGVVSDNDSSDDDDDDIDANDKNNDDDDEYNQINDRNSMRANMVKVLTPSSPRTIRVTRAQQRRQRQEMKQQKLPALGLPLPQTSTLRSRRRLANMLVGAAIIFVGCWTPHVLCILTSEFGHKQYCNITMSYASLLLGYTHSAISPIIYWILNYNALRQSPCAPFMHINTVQRFFRNHLRPAPPPPPSSTNEAALGAFNPRFIKTTPKQYRAQASSHYLY